MGGTRANRLFVGLNPAVRERKRQYILHILYEYKIYILIHQKRRHYKYSLNRRIFKEQDPSCRYKNRPFFDPESVWIGTDGKIHDVHCSLRPVYQKPSSLIDRTDLLATSCMQRLTNHPLLKLAGLGGLFRLWDEAGKRSCSETACSLVSSQPVRYDHCLFF
jgi:hypothetical protein